MGVITRCREPVLAGPLQPFGYIDSRRPLRDGTKFLPPRLSTYTLHYPLTQTSISDFTVSIRGTPTMCLEYVAAPLDPVERNYMCAPTYEHFNFTFAEPGRQRFELRNGVPTFFILESTHRVQEFNFHLNGRGAPVLLTSLHEWDHYKMTLRAMHDLATPEHHATTDYGVIAILKLEEIGLFGMLSEEQGYMELDIEVRNANVLPTDVRLTVVYENRILDDQDDLQKLRFLI
jgi:hypothetical protein